MQLAAFDVVLKLPLVHPVHVRSVVALPAVPTDWPGAQSVHATQAVAAFASWSHVPFAHACFGVVPPAQYVPVSQRAQTAGDAGVAGAACSVPAAHVPTGWQVV